MVSSNVDARLDGQGLLKYLDLGPRQSIPWLAPKPIESDKKFISSLNGLAASKYALIEPCNPPPAHLTWNHESN